MSAGTPVNQPGFVGITILITLGTFGLGRGLLSLVDHLGAPERRVVIADEVAPPVVLTIGVAVYLAVGGLAVAFDLATFRVLVSILLVGVVVTAVRVVARVRSTGLTVPRVHTAIVATAFGLVAFVAYGGALAGPINWNDDDAGYIYLGRRLLSTGGLIDPFNLRRVTAYGGGEIFQALVIQSGGRNAVLGVEWFFFILLVLALVVGRTSRPYAAPVVLILGLGLAVVHPVGIWANSAPTFSGVALTIATLQLVAVSSRGPWNWRYDVCVGMLIGGLLALRFEFAVPVAVVVVIAALFFRRRSGWKPLLSESAVGLCSIVGWAVALQRSSGTVLFPLFSGNYNSAFPWADPSFTTFRQFVSRVWSQIGVDAWGWEIVAILVATIVVVSVGRRWNRMGEMAPIIVVTGAGVIGCAVLLLSETRSLSGGVVADIGRYNAPSALALSCFVVGALWSAAERRDPFGSN
ncbi:MAG TPA: hypothetical protein VG368_06210, partial [Acidimicrobiales bacterium]|nr:hypothetical protein [Acidimicrobiales bacterium]